MSNGPVARYYTFLLNYVNYENTFTKSLEYNGMRYTLEIKNYESLKNSPFPINLDILNTISNHSITSQNPYLHNCIFISTKEPIPYDDHRFAKTLRLSIKLAYFQPAEVSTPIVYIPNLHLEFPSWSIKKNCSPISIETVNEITFNKVVRYFKILDGLDISYEPTLDEIYKMTSIESNIISLLALWSFIEGFWYTPKEQIELSFNKMLKDYSPHDKTEQKRVRAKIKAQNFTIKDDNINTVRVILAHGLYKVLENKWSEPQWNAIVQQRYFLFQIVIESLLNKIKNQNTVNRTLSNILLTLKQK